MSVPSFSLDMLLSFMLIKNSDLSEGLKNYVGTLYDLKLNFFIIDIIYRVSVFL